MFAYDPLETLAAVDGAGRRARRRRPTTRRARGRAALTAASMPRVPRPAGRRIRAASFGHDGHNLMRYRPEAVSAAILSVAGETGG